jgi:hypothetical protein
MTRALINNSDHPDAAQMKQALPWPAALEQGLHDVRAVAVFIGRELGGWQKREMWFALDRLALSSRAWPASNRKETF